MVLLSLFQIPIPSTVLLFYYSSQGMIDLVLDCIDHLHQCSSASQCGETAGEDRKNILNCFYDLLGEIFHV